MGHSKPVTQKRSKSQREVFVGRLPDDANDESVMALFPGATRARISDGHGYVKFDTEENAAAAIAKNGTEVMHLSSTPEH